MRAWPARCVAISTNESLVEVSPSMVMRLKLASAASRTSDCISAGCDHRVGGDEAEHRRHVGRIMPAPLAMPVTVTVRPPIEMLSRRRLGHACRWS